MTREEATRLVRDAIRNHGHGSGDDELDYYADEHVVDGQLDDVVRAVVNGLERAHDQAMPKPTEHGREAIRRRVSEGSDHLRTLARSATPWNRTDNADGSVDFHAIDGSHLFTLTGMWTTPVADYLDAVHPHTGSAVAEIMWQIATGLDPLTTAGGLAEQLLRRQRT